MCTAISLKTRNHYFGRNLDLEYHFEEAVTVMPRRFKLVFRHLAPMKAHLAMIGMATIADGYPLYYDATNEAGLSMAGLNFPGHAHYPPEAEGKDNVAPFEFIPWVLAQCASVVQARALLERLCLAAIPFSSTYSLSPLHWMITDHSSSIVVECMRDGLHVHDNPVGVLTNSPPLPYHLTNLSNYMALSSQTPSNSFDPALHLPAYSRGMGALGLPGDLSSTSRFVRAAFVKAHSISGDDELDSVSQFFHILGTVSHPRGSVMVGEKPQITHYSSCCSTAQGVYYYTTYDNNRICAVSMREENLDSDALAVYPLLLSQDIAYQNAP